ncbi:MAG: DUF4097 domain-containing protein [Rhodanobacteraceae bacterium]|jgi:hypothetical protein|nr:DUF4097 domain-containing protein [Rhodanobacteraceae bacterium]
MKRSLALIVALAPLAAAAECRYTAQHDFDVDAAGLNTLALELGSSDAAVEGVPGLAKVEVRARACASEESWLAGLGVDQQRSGDRLTVTPRRERHASWQWFGSSYAYVDLKVRVPAALAVAIKASSGDADVRNVAALDFTASSGDLAVDRIAGALGIEVSSGDAKGGDVGSVDVRRTGSGDITLRNVRGDVAVARAGSGDLQFDTVGGSVHIGRVGSGDVTVERVQRDVSIDAIGSGDIRAVDVGGDFSVRTKGSGDVYHRDVRGAVSLPQRRD